MECRSCQHDNAPSAKFCQECGARLTRDCTRCNALLSPTTKFCPECGEPTTASPRPLDSAESYTPQHLAEKILTSREAMEGERKQVTVLFADIKSSMELLAGQDPEEARKVLDPVLELMMEAVHHFEGTVNQVMGDGIMALFGAPLAHEDHAVRACYAALDLQERVRRYADDLQRSRGLAVQVRVGLNSGEVVVRAIRNDLRMDYTAVGQTTHLAARMEQMASPGSIRATAETVRLAEGYVQVAPIGAVAIKGLEGDFEVYAITGTVAVHTPLQAAALRGLSRFVGREGEMAELARALAAAGEGRGQVVAVIGEPGVGKSRLFHEFTSGPELDSWLILRAGGASYGRATAYLPLTDALRSYFGLLDRGESRSIAERVRTRVAALDEGLVPMLPALLALVDPSAADPGWQALDRRQRRQRMMDAVRRLLFREGEARPVCFVLEDLHWIDSETRAFLDALVDALPATRLMLLVNYRPEFQHGWGNKTYYTQLRIDSLGPTSSQELLTALLGDRDELTALRKLLTYRTGGNPFFLEESVRALVEDGVLVGERGAYRLAHTVEAIEVPSTVQAVLAARVDRLAHEDKRLLQCAAVIGEHVPVVLLQTVLDTSEEDIARSLARVRAGEFLYETRFFPAEYVFKHGLTRQVAYNSLLRERRRALHARILDVMERVYADQPVEYVERLAEHARRGQQWERAARYLWQAGAKAFAHSANREAVAWFEQALEALARLPDTAETQVNAIDVRLGLRNALTLLGEHERTVEHLHEAQRLAQALGDHRRLAQALSFEANALLLLGRHLDAIDSGRRARALAEELKDMALKTATDIYLGRAYLFLAEFPRAIEIFGGVVDMLVGDMARERLGLPILPSVFARSHLVECLVELGRFEESARHAADAVALAETTSHPDTLLWAHHGTGVHHLARGELARATVALERAYALCRRHDLPAYIPRISAELALAWALGGRAGDAVPLARQAAEQAAARKQAASYSQILLLLGEVCLLAGVLPEADEATAEALDHFRRQHERGHEAWALRLLGDIAARSRSTGPGGAEAHYQTARALARELRMRPLVARCDFGLGRLLRETGQSERAVPALQRAAEAFRAAGMTADVARVDAELKALG